MGKHGISLYSNRSGTGGLLRYLLSKWTHSLFGTSFPVGTLAVNLTGCLLIGFFSGFFDKWIISPNIRLFIFVGLAGGFTTFSAFGLETFNLFAKAEIRAAVLNILVNTIIGISLIFLGFAISQLAIKAGRT